MSRHLALHFLGPPQLFLDEAPISTERRKALALLAYLAMEQEPHQRAALSALLWPDYEQSKAFTNLRHTLWEIQQSIGEDWLITDRETIGLSAEKDLWLDVRQFESLLAQGRAEKNTALRIPLLVEAAQLYRDHLLAGFSLKDAPNFNEWMFGESEDLRRQLADALTLISDDYCSLGQPEKAIPHARRLISLDPLNESAHRQLMQIYLQAGQQSAALKQYQACEQILRKELNLDPQPETLALYKQIRRGDLKTIRGEEPTGMPAAKHNLPTGTVTFLFTDIEGSAKLAQEHRETWEALRARHDAILRAAIESNGGFVSQIIGDAFCAAFHTAGEALNAALKSQMDLQAEDWDGTPIRVRMGIHTGEAEPDGTVYRGYLTLSLVQRVMSAGHGGQILLSNATENLLRGQLPKGATLRDLGEHKLKDAPLPVRIFQAVSPGLPSEFPALRALEVFPNNLPAQFTSFVGREKEIAEIKGAISEHRLVTLTGSGGTGKTRLALQVAASLMEQFADGVWFIELAPVSDPDLIPQTILTTLGLSDRAGQSILDMLEDFLREKRVLLVLDNCEHLIESSAQLTNTLLNAAPQLKVLATSREALGVKGELLYPVPSLSVPDPKHLPPIEQLSQFEAVQLFVDRAQLAAPHFDLEQGNAPFIAQICSRLDGVPLAIELAASRVKVISPEQIAGRLDDRLRLLTGGARTALPRQQTLRATIDWSYNLLSEPEKTLFRRLTVFVGGWSLEAAESVCISGGIETEQVLDLMSQLVNKSLVIAEDVRGESRYHALETIRQYGGEKLSEAAEVETLRDRHLNFYMTLAEELEPKLRTAERIARKKQLEMEQDNFRATLDWSLREAQPDRAEKGVRLACALMRFWHSLGYFSEGRAWLEKGLALLADGGYLASALHAKALYSAGFLATYQGDYASACPLLEESIALYRRLEPLDARSLAAALQILAQATEDLTLARSLTEESLALCRALGPDGLSALASALYRNGHIAMLQNDYATARSLAEESVALFRQIDNAWEVAGPLTTLGHIAVNQKDYMLARACYEESLQLSREEENNYGIGIQIGHLANIHFYLGDYEAAIRLYQESLDMFQDMGNRYEYNDSLLAQGIAALHLGDFEQAGMLLKEGLSVLKPLSPNPIIDESIALNLACLSELARKRQQFMRAARLLGAAEAIKASRGDLFCGTCAVPIVEMFESLIATGHEQLDEAAWQEGQATPLEQVIEYALQDGSE